MPRRLFRYLMLTSEEARLARISHADEETVRRTLRDPPGLLDRVDALLEDGTLGGAQPNAADFQILPAVRVMLEFEDLAHLLEGRACVPVARLLFPDSEGPAPRGLAVS